MNSHFFKPPLPSERRCGITLEEGDARAHAQGAPRWLGGGRAALPLAGAGAVPRVAAHGARSPRGCRGASKGWGGQTVPSGSDWKGRTGAGAGSGVVGHSPASCPYLTDRPVPRWRRPPRVPAWNEYPQRGPGAPASPPPPRCPINLGQSFGGKLPATGGGQLSPVCLQLLLGSLRHEEENRGTGRASPVIK